jgi:FkbM family methyltransferase
VLRRLAPRRRPRENAGPRLLAAFAEEYPRASFAEIGANDGKQHDFLRPLVLSHDWRGLIVEPVPYVFERLRANYAGQERLSLQNVAIAPESGERPFFHLAEVDDPQREGLPEWYDGIGSFSRDELLSHAPHIPDIADRVVETRVPCVTLEELCARNGFDQLDLLLIDTEGYDWEIIRHLDLAKLGPRVIVYEHYHRSPDDRAACSEHLASVGYETIEEHFDTFGLAMGPDDALSRLWTRLEPVIPGIAAYEDRS